jgi:hypothetical protein
MDKIIKKLTSRKFWAALAAWLTSLLTAFNVADTTISRIILIVSGIGALCVYIFAEGLVDKNNKEPR